MSENVQISGIDEEKIEKLIMDVYDYYEKIKLRLDHIDQSVDKLALTYKCSSFDSFLNNFENSRSEFKKINANIQMYANDLKKAKKNFKEIFKDTSVLIPKNK